MALIFLPGLSQIFAQEIKMTKLELRGDELFIHYTIDDSNPSNEYLVNVYSSTNKFAAPLTKVSGDVGEEVKPGNRVAQWNIREELGEYAGEMEVELRARVFIPFVRLQSFDDGKVYKRGKSYDVTWKPGNTNPVHIELYSEGTRLQGELNHPNNGDYTITFNSKLKPGNDYKLKMTDSRKSDNFVYSTTFKMRRKFPLVLQVAPIAILAGGLTAFIVTTTGNSGGGKNDLPDFPEVPTN